ncbi:MAG: hypothetical protein IJU86_01040 [Firmicutes bacterium]|nr:hypothetical protein [Bacillota bacterium]
MSSNFFLLQKINFINKKLERDKNMYLGKINNAISKCFLIFIIGLFNLFLFLFPKEILNSSHDAIIL